MATKQKIKSARDTVSKAQSVIDAADKSLRAAEKASVAAGQAKSRKGLIFMILALLTILGITYFLKNSDDR